jgi:acetyl-CoA C-acetyltransferase
VRRGAGPVARPRPGQRVPVAPRPHPLRGAALAWQQGLVQAGLGLDDLDFVETHDCFTMAELLQYEAMGLAPQGQGRAWPWTA